MFGLLNSVLPQVSEKIDEFMMGLENMKVISCRDEVKQFAKKYLIPDWIDVTETKSGFLLKFPLEKWTVVS